MGCVGMPQEQLPYIPPTFCLRQLGKTRALAMKLIILSLVAALIARYPFVAAALSPSSFRSNPQPAVSQSVRVHAQSLEAVR
jgi:hypothetical protein